MAKDTRAIHKGIRFGQGAADGDYFNEDSDADDFLDRVHQQAEEEVDGDNQPIYTPDDILRRLTIDGAISGFIDDDSLDQESPDADVRLSARHKAALVQDVEAKPARQRRGKRGRQEQDQTSDSEAAK